MLPVLLSFGPFRLYGYGVMITLGCLIGARLLWLRRERMGLKSEEEFWALLNVACLSGFVGGKLLFMLQYGLKPGLSIMNGYSAFGGFVSVPLAVWGFARWKKIPFLKLADYMFLAAFFWHAFGRFGCFLAGCCWGKPTTLPWGLAVTDPRSQTPRELLGVPLHPVQLYEVAGILLLCALMYRFLRAAEEGRSAPGLVVATHFGGYGVLRFLLEFLRDDKIVVSGSFTQGQALGLGLIAASGGVLLWRAKCSRSS
ncbi:MAG: prolipoprotein diacylglyceryl transferase [Elusimicrobiota bacterium]|nr:MAG: prolipoprotein diacylglyceryl transferase [Elusimicrobiota bacterium]